MKSKIFIFTFCCLVSLNALAKVKTNSLFSNNMVLQQGVVVPVWGTADENEAVSIEFCGQKVSAVTKDGKWFVQLQALKSGGPFEMTLTGKDVVKISNILVGEVWVCSGQSNMERKLGLVGSQKPIIDWQNEAKDAANYPQIRQYAVPRNPSIVKVEDAKGKWAICDSITVKGFSAVGFFFARSLTQSLKNVPVGLIFSAVGGTPAEKWTSRATLETNEELKSIVAAYEKSILDFPTAAAKFKLNEDSLLTKWKADTTAARIAKKTMPRKPSAPVDPVKSGDCGGLYNGMIAPLIPYAIKGAIWYQGESNSGKAKLYQTLFPAMIADWRKAWNIGDFPFYFVQIAPHMGQSPEIREAQLLTLKKSPNTAMAVTVDCGDSADIHPANKRPVGERLALAARALNYKQKVAYSGPIYSSMEVKGNTIVLSFDHVNKGLEVKGSALTDFVISADGKKFVPAKAEIKGKTVIVSAENVTTPVAVRMGWNKVPHVNLFNKDGLPASPFRTDVQ